jgi:hypothetical protein
VVPFPAFHALEGRQQQYLLLRLVLKRIWYLLRPPFLDTISENMYPIGFRGTSQFRLATSFQTELLSSQYLRRPIRSQSRSYLKRCTCCKRTKGDPEDMLSHFLTLPPYHAISIPELAETSSHASKPSRLLASCMIRPRNYFFLGSNMVLFPGP